MDVPLDIGAYQRTLIVEPIEDPAQSPIEQSETAKHFSP